MSFYHVRITEKTDPGRGTVKLDLTSEKLEEIILTPYKKGELILIDGKLIRPNDINRISIHKTDKGSESFRSSIEQRRKTRGIAQLFSSVEEDLAIVGEEVTNILIVGPPGSEFEAASSSGIESRPEPDNRDIFVSYGRNEGARDALFQFLRSIGLNPIEWSVAVMATNKPAPYIGEILDAAFSRAHAVVVLLTPDDEARLREPFRKTNEDSTESKLTGQARQNVLFEAGAAMAHRPNRTVIVELGTLRPFSNISGLHTVRLDDSAEKRKELAQRLSIAGCPVDLGGNDWIRTGEFESAVDLPEIAQRDSDTTVNSEGTPKGLSSLSADAESLLVEAAGSKNGDILRVQTMGGLYIQVNGKVFPEVGNRRSEARWDRALKDLLVLGLVESLGGKGEVFEVTHAGFQLADELAQTSGQT